MKREKYKKLQCEKCKEFIGSNNLKKHIKKCNGLGKHYNCIHCGAQSLRLKTKGNKFCSLYCMSLYYKNNPNIHPKTRYNDTLIKEIYKYYEQGFALLECVEKYNLTCTTTYLVKKFNKLGLKARTRKENAKLYRLRGLFPPNILQPQNTKEYWTIERRKCHSDCMKKAVQEHPESYINTSKGLGYLKKVKRYKTTNSIGEELTVRGTWELLTVEYFTKKNIYCTNKLSPFIYIDKDNKEHLYYPDFYLPLYDLYIEVKGKVIEKDIYKYKNFPKFLLYLHQTEIQQLKRNRLDLFKLVKDVLVNYDVVKIQQTERLLKFLNKQ